MDFPIDAERWLSDPDGVVEAIFAEGGPVAALVPGYARNEKQVEYARLVARTAVRGQDPAKAGKVTPLEGSTGLGKTIAILVVAGIASVLSGRKALVTTYTRALNRQMAGRDGEIASRVVGIVVGRESVLAMRRPRSAFASPSRCRAQAALLRREADEMMDAYVVEKHRGADALDALADWTDTAIAYASGPDGEVSRAAADEFVRGFRGLVETFLTEREDLKADIGELPYDLYTQDGASPERERILHAIYDGKARDADVLVATHAAIVLDQSFFGNVLDRDGTGFSLVVADEGNRLEAAGVLALGLKRALSSFRRERELILGWLQSARNQEENVEKIYALVDDQTKEGEEMMIELIDVGKEMRAARERERIVHPDETWVETLRSLHLRSSTIIDALDGDDDEVVIALVDQLCARYADMATFLDCIDRVRNTADFRRKNPNARVPHDVYDYALPKITFSPFRSEPSVLVRPKNGARILSRLWTRNGREPKAAAVVVTSATMGISTTPHETSFASILDTVGLDETSPFLNRDLMRSVEMTRFGKMRELILAAPDAPAPHLPSNRRNQDADLDPADGRRNPDWSRFVAEQSVEAVMDTWREPGRSRCVLLCTSFSDVEALGDEIIGSFDGPIHCRTASEPVEDGFDWLSGVKQGILVTTGAFDGIDRPGLIDHLIIPKLPFPATDGPFYSSFVDGQGTTRWSPRTEEMLMSLKQGIGRAFRKHDDEAAVRILDRRIGVPRSYVGLRAEGSDSKYLGAIPSRFSRQVDRARLVSSRRQEEAA